MKRISYILLGLMFYVGMSSCNDFLDVNTDPDYTPSETTPVNLRLSWIQNYYTYAWGTAGMRANTEIGTLTQTYSTSASNSLLAAWDPTQGTATTVYQNWYVGAAVNIGPMIKKAEETGAYHYAGAGYCIKAMGFMMMLDLHGELPIQEAFIFKTDPKYDDGKMMYQLCMEYLDKAIENFNKTQITTDPKVKALSAGDLWNGGDVSKWLKLCYGLKARYMLKLSKKADLYNGDAILAELAKAPQSNSDNTYMTHYNIAGDQVNFTVSDPYQTSAIWDCTAYGTTQRLTLWYVNLLTNNFTGGSGVIDPRMSKLVPAMMKNVSTPSTPNATGKVPKDSEGFYICQWARDVGVDMMNSDIRKQTGPINSPLFANEKTIVLTYSFKATESAEKAAFIAAMTAIHTVEVTGNNVKVTYQKGAAYCNSTDYKRAGDTVYVNLRTNSLSTSGRSASDMFYYPSTSYDYVAGTGTFYARPNSDSDLLTYAEMCFIKAEVYFRKGDAGNAYTAYRNGIQAHFDRMQAKLNQWKVSGSKNPDEMPMNPADITAYMGSGAVCQAAGSLTMAEIMRQKMIAMGFDLENWNDMRRFNYSAGNIGSFGNVYPDYKRPKEFAATNKMVGGSPADLTYWPRRWTQSSHESSYNLTQLKASNKQAMTDPIWSCPVWWDCSTDAEYYSFIK